MRVKLGQTPFVRILIPFALGILIEFYFPSHFLFLYVGIFFLLLVLLWNWRETIKGVSYPRRWINGVLVAICFFASGYNVTLLRSPAENKNYVRNNVAENKDSLLVTLISIPQEKQKTYKATGEITGVIKNRQHIVSNGKALFYFHKDSASEKLNYGDELLIYSQLRGIEPPSNPDEFDYRQFLQTRGINYECYVSNDDYSVIGTTGSNALLRFANNSRKRLTALLHKEIGGNEADIASAILLGYREDLSRSVVQSFVDSGVVHVICVAGLHVGILFILLSYIIVFPEKFKYGKLLSVLLILILLWLYALFTGLATPVLRATIMFSFLTVGKHLRKYTNSVNILAASAFLILLFSPTTIIDPGFQLSYLAVLGILVIYKPLLSLFEPKHILIKKVWELTCVSISAQLAVLPLSLLYFHQFPNYFIISNILVVPLLTIVICAGIFFFLVSWIPTVSALAAWMLQKCILLMSTIVSGVSRLPFSTYKGISISYGETLLLFLFILSIIAYFFTRKKYLFISGLLLLAIFTTIRVAEKIIHSQQKVLTIYNIPGKSAITFISGESGAVLYSTVDSNDIAMHMQYNLWKLGVNNNLLTRRGTNATLLSGMLMVQNQFVQFNNSKFAVIQQNTDLPPGKFSLHCLIVSEGYNLDMLSLKNAFNFDTVIFDSSVQDNKLRKWEAECKELNLHYYSVKTQGAYIENC